MLEWNIPYVNDEHKSLANLVKDFCEREVDVRALQDMADVPIPANATPNDLRKRLPTELMSKAHDAGLRQIAAPTEYGGGGYEEEHVALAVMAETAAYYGGMQFGRLLTIAWKQMAAFKYTSKEVAEEVLGDFMKDRTTMLAASITEPNSGSDMLMPYDEPGAAGQVTARKEGDNWIINGDKMFCTAGGVSNYVMLMARTDPNGPLTKSVTQFCIDTRRPGWSILRVNDMMGNEIVSNVQTRYENYVLPDRYRVSPVNGAFEVMKSRLAGKTLHIFTVLGWSERAWDDMIEYAKTRVQGGRPIIEHQNVGMLLAETGALLRALRLMMYQDAWDWDSDGQGQMRDVLGWYYINWYAKSVALKVIEAGMEIYAGLSIQKELNFEHYIRLCMSMFHGGSTGRLSLVKAGHVLAKGAFGSGPRPDTMYEA
ncbi:MAG: acyl-CoA dehydrogenase [Deltaproteobacteria bacterium]|nr:acyl-CoA dehydrogenase [Deltaproteobacteria bacterium]